MAEQTTADTGILPATHWSEAFDNEDSKSILSEAESSTASLTSSIFAYRTLHGRRYHSDRGESSQYWGANDDRQNEALDIKYCLPYIYSSHLWTTF